MNVMWIILKVIISIIILTVSILILLYLAITKDLRIIASIESEKIPLNLKSKIIIYFIITLMLASILLSDAILLIEENLMIGMLLVTMSIIICLPFYIFYNKVKE